MTFAANVVNVLIASPSDTAAERDAVEAAIHRWNADRAQEAHTVLLPLRWEVNAVPVMANSPQAAINRQLLERADIVIGVFYARLGQPTERYPSGTVEEILEAHDAGKQVHVYFSTAPLPPDIDLDQLARLRDVKADLGQRSLYGQFASADELQVQVRSAIEHDLAELGLSAPTVAAPPVDRAALRASYTTSGRSGRIVVTNDGRAVARNVRMALEPVGRGSLPFLDDEDSSTARDIPPNGGRTSYLSFGGMGTASLLKVTLTWFEESGEEQEFSHTLSLM
jgi:hypothetical protein